MEMKKKIGVGVLTGMIGLSLVGGGTWAAFNDVEQLSGSFATGELDFTITDRTAGEDGSFVLFEDANLKPGDELHRTITFRNNGSLHIDKLLVHVDEGVFAQDFSSIPNSAELSAAKAEYEGEFGSIEDAFLDQFVITFLESDRAAGNLVNPVTIPGARFSLLDLKEKNYTGKIRSEYITNGDLDLSTTRGLEVGDQDVIKFEIEFENDDERIGSGGGTDRLFKQNVFQGASMNFGLSIEATQDEGFVGTEDGELETRNGLYQGN
ncbi:hypothetical protein FLK61_29690 [Paenalkalicoccus suaedae]|uniref:Spore coat protein n=1 Tax=Paenalkalicoccus suaedae TaxID=2592382 RepID=A0A859FDJ3_9BACI|nr:TasA family protein [Paenalkalicoccus suaedae]QKS70901.1 hypothetical protein FLK61_29690 [Paenalkalicoccus suaedae]